MKPLRKALFYFLFYVASTLFVYFFFTAAMNIRNVSDPSSITSEFLGKCVFLPFLYCSFSLTLAVFLQSKCLVKEDKTETMIYACFNIVFFLLVGSLSIILFVLGNRDNCLALNVAAIAFLSFAILEIGYSVYLLLGLKKAENPIMPIEENENVEK